MNPKYAVRNRGKNDRFGYTRRSKLTEEDIPGIRERIAKGDMLKDIAADYGVSSTTISAIKSGGTWSYIH
jgi:hypothetical protein